MEAFDARSAWNRLALDYEESRTRAGSLDNLVEFPAQLAFIGDVTGRSILDVGCGSGAKALHFARAGARNVIGVDVSDVFIEAWRDRAVPASLSFVQGDIDELDRVDELDGRSFDLVLVLQVLGFARDRTAVLRWLARHLVSDGAIVLQTSSPIRFAVERAERLGLPIGAAYHSGGVHRYASSWNPDVILEHQTPRFSELLTSIADAGLYVERCVEPAMPDSVRADYPEKAEWWDKYGGIILYELRRR